MNVGEENLRDNQPRRHRVGQSQESMAKSRVRRWNEQRRGPMIRHNHPIILSGVREEIGREDVIHR